MFITQLNQFSVFHDLRADESLLEIGMNDSSSLWCFCLFTNCPTSDLISSSCEVVNQIKGLIACFNNFGKHASLVLIFAVKLFPFVFSTVRNDLSWHISVNVIFNFFKPFVFFINKIITAEIDQIHN